MSIAEPTRRWLLAHARHALATALGCERDVPAPGPAPADPQLTAPARLFVSWHDGARLLGCIGTLAAHDTLSDAVATYAVQAGLHDPRMMPMTAADLRHATAEIAVLSEPHPLDAVGLTQIAAAIVPRRDGVIVTVGPRRGVFLPSVWDKLPEPAAFLDALCRKAGIDPRHEGDEVTAQVFVAETWAEAPGG